MKEDIEILENYIYGKKETMKELLVPAIENLLKAYKEDEAVIEEMAEQLIGIGMYDECEEGLPDVCRNEKEVKEYFRNKAKGGKE